ncbi:MAG TPA: FG-GAP-like repeat-containing protein, partial [Candidatus Saccharimonadales bacterium]|nr:FG-GAP-like repeat-containing protein [Candidatus Saccharimonadales bacterium]
RHLRQGIDQIRRDLPESAQAELKRCLDAKPEDAEALFQSARLRLLPGDPPPDPKAAGDLLERSLKADPKSVAAHRVLYEMALRSGDRAGADSHLRAIAEIYGPVGALEARLLESFETQGKDAGIPMNPPPGTDPDLARLETAWRKLHPRGDYTPGEAVDTIEALLKKYPDLEMVRFLYAKRLLIGQVRLKDTRGGTLPPLSSTLVLDFAQSHFEHVFDRSDPGSRLGLEALVWLSEVALRMADYEQAETYLGIILHRPETPRADIIRAIGKEGFIRYKQKHPAEAIPLLKRVVDALPQGDQSALPYRWLLRLAYEDAGTPPAQRAEEFEFRHGISTKPDAYGITFKEVAHERGVDTLGGLGPSAWGDYDGDGDFDLYVSGCDSYGILYRNDGGKFTDVSREAGLFHAQSGFSATFADYDNDGFPDLYVGRDGWNGAAANSLYHNNGDGTFTDVTREAGLGDAGSTFVHAWADVDRDGDIDLFLANGITGGGDTNALYLNNGDGTFTNASAAAGFHETPGTRTIGVAFGDYDGDGWPDLFASGYYTVNRLYHNLGNGTFREVATQAGVDGANQLSTGYVTLFIDYDNDLRPDILRTSLGDWLSTLASLSGDLDLTPPSYRRQIANHLAPKLYHNLGGGRFKEVAGPEGLEVPIGIMSANSGDLNNDGWIDLYFGTGDPEVDRLEPDRFFLGGPKGFTDATFASGLGDIGKGHGVTMVDLDGDGDLDIYVPEGGFVHGDPWPNVLYINEQKTGNHWLQIDLIGVASNRDALDTRVVALAGGREQLREVHDGEGFGSTNSPTVEFGLGRSAKVERLSVRWPSGTRQEFREVAADRRYRL